MKVASACGREYGEGGEMKQEGFLVGGRVTKGTNQFDTWDEETGSLIRWLAAQADQASKQTKINSAFK